MGAKGNRGKLVAKVLAGAAVVALAGLVLARVFLFSVYKVPSGSMIPTLEMRTMVAALRTGLAPRRGMVIAFPLPEHPDQSFLKRIVGLPGDVIEVEGEELHINGWTVPRCRVGEWAYDDAFGGETTKHPGTLYVEHLDGVSYLVFFDKTGFASDRQGPFVVKPNEAFVLGDNRHNSHDSRMWFGGQGGGVPASTIQARLLGHDGAHAPRGAESLSGALADCMSKRPATTSPPPPRPASAR